MFSLSPQTHTALRLLTQAGFEAYIVGGCVRDYLLGTSPKDIDIATSAKPEETKAVFADFRTVDTGIRHGTVTVLIGEQSFEITTYRVDVGYSDGRHPDAVQFTPSLREDAARRDFTVNAMAYHPQTGVVDFFGGRDDLAAGIIRCVGEPDRRFEEDALRILRALRFAALLGFGIDAATADALFRHKRLLLQVSAERVTEELCRLLCGKGVGDILAKYLPVIAAYLPELDSLSPALAGALCGRVRPELPLRFAALLCRLPFAQAQQLLQRLRPDRKTRQTILSLLTVFHRRIFVDKPPLRRLIAEYSAAIVIDALTLLAEARALSNDSHGAYDMRRARVMVDQILADGDCCTIEQLAIRGSKLAELGFVKTEISEMLWHLFYEVTDDRLENTREALLAEARRKR